VSREQRAPAFMWYPAAWLSDPKVRALSKQHRSDYMDLLCYMWEHGAAGCEIPRETAERLFSAPFISAIADGPAPLVNTSYKDDGSVWLDHDRLYDEAVKCRTRSDKARASRACNQTAPVRRTSDERQTNVERTSDYPNSDIQKTLRP